MKKNKIIKTVAISTCSVLSVALIVGTIVASRYKPLITNALGQSLYKVENVDGSDADTEYYKSDYTKLTQLQKAEAEYAHTVQQEGAILLENGTNNDIIPLSKSLDVTLLGSSCGTADNAFQYGGGGAGSIDTKNTPSLKEAFEDAGYKVNPTMWSFYTTGAGKSQRSATSVGEAAISSFTSQETGSISSYSDVGIIVIGRPGQESSDLSTDLGNGKHMLELSDEELALVDYATASSTGFKKVIMLLNTMNPMELSNVNKKNMAVIWIGAGGQKGVEAIPSLLNGDSYPSGRIVDTYAADNLSAPAMVNFGEFTIDNGDTENHADKIVSYQEGIYVGYRYYETRYEDVVLGNEQKTNFDYSALVSYPFGYGKSLTEFTYSDFKMTDDSDNFYVSVEIKNTGDKNGKEVAQLYLQSPYTQYDKTNGVEKSAVELIGFKKTGELKPNQSEKVEITVSKEELRSYDSNKAKTYIADEGNYYFAFGKNSHDSLNNILAKKKAVGDTSNGTVNASLMDDEGDASLVGLYKKEFFSAEYYNLGSDGEKITNRLDDIDYKYYDSSYKYLTRSNWTGSWPTPLGGEDKTITVPDKVMTDTKDKYADDSKAKLPTMNTVSTEYGKLSLASVRDMPVDSEYWDVLCDQLSADDMYEMVRMGGYATPLITSVNKPATVDKDGPAGISSTLVGGAGCFGFPVEVLISSTWNEDLAEQMGDFVGEDGLYSGVSGWYAPGLNNHRTPFAGRNFEYYSEDGFLGGKMGAAVTRGCQAKGVFPYMKHYAFNDQETARMGLLTFTNEQAAREVYLPSFEITVREGKALGLMVTGGRVGSTWCGAHKGMMTDVLRNEWGFKGISMTDQASYAMLYYQYMDAGLLAGTDMWLNSDSTLWPLNYQNNPTLLTAMRRASKNILYVVSQSNAMNGISANSKVVSVMPPWEIALIVVDTVIWASTLGLIGTVAFSSLLKKKKQ